MKQLRMIVAVCSVVVVASACAKPASTSAAPASASAGTASAAADNTIAAQIEHGARLYGQYCAGCHGDAGQGSSGAPPVVGKSALPLDPPASAKARTVKFRTALDVGQWVMKYMPAKRPASLSAAQYLAILAFDLKANGVKLTAPLTVEGARGIVLHP